MPITRPSPPLTVMAALFEGLPAFLSGPNFGSAGTLVSQQYAGAAPSIPTAVEIEFPIGGPHEDLLKSYSPLQIFVLGLTDVANNKSLSAAAVPAGWRFFIGGTAAGKTVMARVSQRPPSGIWKVASVHYGAGVKKALMASLELEGSPPTPAVEPSYQMRMLLVPELNLEAFWLNAQTAGPMDLLIPFPAGLTQLVGGLRTELWYTEADFITAIRPLALLEVPANSGG